ncbi:hypothetical protein EDD11_000274 [Mortierella claussenii]|nr:hypothetical protein EDD11_000274 [Mortierella claussenii]
MPPNAETSMTSDRARSTRYSLEEGGPSGASRPHLSKYNTLKEATDAAHRIRVLPSLLKYTDNSLETTNLLLEAIHTSVNINNHDDDNSSSSTAVQESSDSYKDLTLAQLMILEQFVAEISTHVVGSSTPSPRLSRSGSNQSAKHQGRASQQKQEPQPVPFYDQDDSPKRQQLRARLKLVKDLLHNLERGCETYQPSAAVLEDDEHLRKRIVAVKKAAVDSSLGWWQRQPRPELPSDPDDMDLDVCFIWCMCSQGYEGYKEYHRYKYGGNPDRIYTYQQEPGNLLDYLEKKENEELAYLCGLK